MNNFGTPEFGKVRKLNTSDLTRSPDSSMMLKNIKEYFGHAMNGNVQGGRNLLERMFPSREQRVMREQQLSAIETEGLAQRRMMKVFYESVTGELEQVARARYELAQIQHDAAVSAKLMHESRELYAQQREHLRIVFQSLQPMLDDLEMVPEEYRPTSKAAIDQVYYDQLSQVLLSIATFKRRTEAMLNQR